MDEKCKCRFAHPPHSPWQYALFCDRIKEMTTDGQSKSRLNDELRDALMDQIQRMLPEERLRAFVEHSQLMVQLMHAGRRYRAGVPPPPASS